MKKHFLITAILFISALCGGLATVACDGDSADNAEHTHVFNRRAAIISYMKSGATCIKKAEYYLSCGCGAKGEDTFESGELGGHNFADYISNGDATCLQNGTQTGTCVDCGVKNTREHRYSASGHDFTSYISDGNTTCTERGTETATCTRCDAKGTREVDVSAVGHSFLNYLSNDDATCTKNGTQTAKCERCAQTNTREVENSALGHSYNESDVCVRCENSAMIFTLNDDGNYSISGLSDAKIKTLFIPATHREKPITLISELAFLNCDLLASITVDENNPNYCSIGGILYNKDKTQIIYVPQALFGEVTIPQGVTMIADNTFANRALITGITIPQSVTTVGYGAFMGCSAVKSVTIVGEKSFSSMVFFGCDGLENVEIDGSAIWTLPKSSLKNVVITGGNVGVNALYNCKSLQFLYLREGVTALSTMALYGCTSLTRVTIADGLTELGDYAFYNCYRLSQINIPDSVKKIGKYAFYNCSSLKNIAISKGVEAIGESALGGCLALEAITIPFVGAAKKNANDDNQYPFGYIFGSAESSGGALTKQEYIGKGESTFANYYLPATLKEVTVTGGRVVYGAFGGCSGLTKINLTDNVTNIDDCAFVGCAALASVTISARISVIGNKAFFGCEKLTEIVIPNGAAKIGASAFEGCTELKNAIIPDGIQTIGGRAFMGCAKLERVAIGSGLSELGDKLFAECAALTKITLPDSVKKIGDEAFYACGKLSQINLSQSLESVGRFAFFGCAELQVIFYKGTKEQWNGIPKADNWDSTPANYVVSCADGVIEKKDDDGLILCAGAAPAAPAHKNILICSLPI